MKQKGLGSFFGIKDPESSKKNAIIKKVEKKSLQTDFDNLIKNIKIKDTSKFKIPSDVKDLITWKAGEPIPFASLAKELDEIEKLSGKLEIIDIASRYFLSVLLTTPQDIVPYVFLLTGTLRPNYEGVKLNIGDESIKSAIGVDKATIKQQLESLGDLALVAQKCKQKQKTMTSLFGKASEPFTVVSVYKEFLKIASFEGEKTAKQRQGIIQKLLTNAKPEEVKSLVRMLQCNLRVGAGQELFFTALGYAFKRMEYLSGITKHQPTDDELKEAGKAIRLIYYRYPLIDQILIHCIQGGIEEAEEQCNITVNIPSMPMLAKPAKTIAEIKRRLGDDEITGEYKYDGERAMIHKTKEGKIRIFSRSAEDSTDKFFDVANVVKDNVKGDTFILDSEIVAFDTQKNIILPFQTLIQRPKKGSEKEVTIQVCIFAFDLLYLNGEPLIEKPLIERRKKLHEIVNVVDKKLQLATYKNAKKIEELGDFFKEAVEHRTEGLMVKTLHGKYEPGKRSMLWGKMKKDYIKADVFNGGEADDAAPPDTMDVVVIGATLGQGKRTNTYGSFLVSVYDQESGKFQSLAFVGTGFSDELLEKLYKELKPGELKTPPKSVDCPPLTQNPVFFEPKMVWEITIADLQKTTKYKAAWGELGDCGITIRFGRYMRTRDDKAPEQCTSSEQLVEFYHGQFEHKTTN